MLHTGVLGGQLDSTECLKNDFTGQGMLKMYNIDAKLELLVLHRKPSTSFQATVDASWLGVG